VIERYFVSFRRSPGRGECWPSAGEILVRGGAEAEPAFRPGTARNFLFEEIWAVLQSDLALMDN
jgi:hypothetical protein